MARELLLLARRGPELSGLALAREGARRAVLEQSTADEVETIVTDYLAGNSVSGATVSPGCTTTSPFSGRRRTRRITVSGLTVSPGV